MSKSRPVGLSIITLIQSVEWLLLALLFLIASVGFFLGRMPSRQANMTIFYVFISVFLLAYGYICFNFIKLKKTAYFGMMIMLILVKTILFFLFFRSDLYLVLSASYGAWFYWYLSRNEIKARFI